MNKAISVIILGVILMASFFVGYTLLKGTYSTSSIPPLVLAKYEELESQYKKSLGASINYCTKNNEKIYTVSGSGGYSGVTFYYTEDGREIGSSSWTDVIDINNPPPESPINIWEYECTVIKESKQFVNE